MAVAITSFVPTGGEVGDTVVITGSDFEASQGTGSVALGGHTATISSWADTSITCVLAGAPSTGNQTLLVTNDSASSASDTLWVYELSSIVDTNWNAKQHFQVPGAAGDSNPEDRTVSDSRDLNRALEHIDHLKRWASGDAATQFVCILRKDNAQTIESASAFEEIDWDTTTGTPDVEVTDPTGMHSDATAVKKRITIPTGAAGVYLVTVNIQWGAAFTTSYKAVKITQYNSSDTVLWVAGDYRETNNITSGGLFSTVSMTVVAAVGDYFKVSVLQESGSDQTIGGALATGFSVARLWGL